MKYTQAFRPCTFFFFTSERMSLLRGDTLPIVLVLVIGIYYTAGWGVIALLPLS